MQLTEDDIRAFQAAWHSDFGEMITPEQARREVHLLLELYGVLYAPPRRQQGESDRNQ